MRAAGALEGWSKGLLKETGGQRTVHVVPNGERQLQQLDEAIRILQLSQRRLDHVDRVDPELRDKETKTPDEPTVVLKSRRRGRSRGLSW